VFPTRVRAYPRSGRERRETSGLRREAQTGSLVSGTRRCCPNVDPSGGGPAGRLTPRALPARHARSNRRPDSGGCPVTRRSDRWPRRAAFVGWTATASAAQLRQPLEEALDLARGQQQRLQPLEDGSEIARLLLVHRKLPVQPTGGLSAFTGSVRTLTGPAHEPTASATYPCGSRTNVVVCTGEATVPVVGRPLSRPGAATPRPGPPPPAARSAHRRR